MFQSMPQAPSGPNAYMMPHPIDMSFYNQPTASMDYQRYEEPAFGRRMFRMTNELRMMAADKLYTNYPPL